MENNINNNNNAKVKRVYWPSVFYNDNLESPIEWNKCVLTKLGIDSDTKSIGYAHIKLDQLNGKLILSATDQEEHESDGIFRDISNVGNSGIENNNNNNQILDQKVIIAHSKGCPFHDLEISKSTIHQNLQNERLKEPLSHPPVKVGVSVLVEDYSNQRILLTKRSEQLRIFPGIFVLPGGHMENGESIFETGLRELEEEVGIDKSMIDLNSLKVIGIFESSYPVLLQNDKLPIDHHMVIFINVKLNTNSNSNSNSNINNNSNGETSNSIINSSINLKLQESEVELAAWVSKSLMSNILENTFTEYDLLNNNNNNNNNNSKKDRQQQRNSKYKDSIDLIYSNLANKNNNENLTEKQIIDKLFRGTSNIATGTIYILKQYLGRE